MKAQSSPVGVQFPCVPSGQRSTTNAGRTIFAASMSLIDCPLSDLIRKENNWRQNYLHYMPNMMLSAAQTPKTAEAIAQQGLEACYKQFEFYRHGKGYRLNQAMALFKQERFHSAVIEGKGTSIKGHGLSLQHKGEELFGEGLKNRIVRWLDKGIIEKSHAQSLIKVLNNEQIQDLTGQYFVLLGAGSEIGPLSMLLALGANVIAVGRPSKKNWLQLINIARESSGQLIIPCSENSKGMSDNQIAQVAGADLLTHTPEIAVWVDSFKAPMTIGNYAYLDGSDHVRVAMAMDAISATLLEKRNDISLAYLLTPTDVYAVPEDVLQHCNKRLTEKSVKGVYRKLLNVLSFGRLFSSSIYGQVPTVNGKKLGILDNLISQQGPSYVLAKRIQRWRAIHSVKQGIRVSCNVAPATSTKSVMSNRFFAAATMGSENFGVEVFTPQTANALMTLQLIFDIKDTQVQERGEELFIHGANHGGSWYLGYCFRSVLVPSLVVGLLQKLLPKKQTNFIKPEKQKQAINI